LAGVVAATILFFGGICASAQEGVDLRGRGPLDASPDVTRLGNRPGMSIGRTPPSAYGRRDRQSTARPDQLVPPAGVSDYPVNYPGTLLEGLDIRELGEPGAMTIGMAIDQMVHSNPDIAAAHTEIEQARADIITAGLRANPQFFTDMQLVPYRVLAPNQADVNLAYPMDLSGKRRTRVKSAACVLRSVEWRYRDFVRAQVDNLYTVFVDTLVAQEAEKRASRLLRDAEGALEDLRIDPRAKRQEIVASEKALRQTKHDQGDAASALRDNRRALARLLNRPDPEALLVRGIVYDPRTFSDETDEARRRRLAWLKGIAFTNRPDLEAQRWNLCRAVADIDAIRASRFDDVTLLVEPYTYAPFLPDHVGWALGVTVPMPIYNRQQGNLAKGQQVVMQARALLASLENAVAAEVEAAYNAVMGTQDDMAWFKEIKEHPPDALTGPTLALRLKDRDPEVADHFDKLDRFVRVLMAERSARDDTNYYSALIQHRKSLLRLNTACACIVWGFDPSPFDPPAELPPPDAPAPRAADGAAARSR
jgi:cobalt-zinc-cadmium efflux system outer membrane protein